MRTTELALALLLAAGAGACGGGEEAPADGSAAEAEPRRDLPPGLAARVDSGNSAYRAGDYQEARRHFREAVDLAPGSATAWFGVHMAERALGNDAAADSALEHVQGMEDVLDAHGMPGGGEMRGGGRMPAGHPPVDTAGAGGRDAN